MSEADNDQASVLNQVIKTELMSKHYPFIFILTEPSCLNKALEDQKHEEATKLPSPDVSGSVTTVTSLAYSQLEGLVLDPDTNANQNGKDKAEITTVEFSRSSSQTHMESPQNILPASVVALGSCTSASNERNENSQCYLEGDREPKYKGCNDMATADVPTVMKEEEVGLPPKKKQRMGKCVLTLKGFSYQRNVKIGKSTMETDVQKCNNTVHDGSNIYVLISLSVPAERATEQNETEVQSQPINGPEVSR